MSLLRQFQRAGHLWVPRTPLRVPGSTALLRSNDASNFVLDGTDIIAWKDSSRDLDNPVVNGTFAADASWTKGTNWTIPTPTANAAGATAAQYLEQNALTASQRFLLEADVTVSANSMTPYGGTVAGTAVAASASIAQVITPDGAALKFGGHAAGFTGTIDNVVVTPGNHGYQPTSANRPVWDSVNKCATGTGASSEFLDTGIEPGNAGTIMLWLRMPSYAGANNSPWGTYDGTDVFDLTITNTHVIRSYLDSKYVGSSVAFTPAVWHHITVTWDIPTGEMSITVNGTRDEINTIGGETMPSGKSLYLLARNLNGASNREINGDISGFQMWDRALSAAEIAYEYGLGRNP